MALNFDTTTQMLQQSLDVRLKRQTLLNSNLANLDTPNFKPADLKFQGFLATAMDGSTNAEASAEIKVDTSESDSLDGNTVDLDQEVAKLDENKLRYNTALELMRRKMAILRYATGS